jgi:ATP-binding cassette subfamily B (MDR/TAP) protein 1
MLRQDEITPGIVVNVFFAVLIGAFSLGNIAPDVQAMTAGKSSAASIFETIDRVPEIDSYNTSGTVIARENIRGSLNFDNISFVYPSRPDVPVLSNISFKAEPGTTVALVGESGSGKSTIVSLLERFYDPTGGSISLDGVPLTQMNLTSLRQHIGLVSQEPVLFEGTVYDNVVMGLAGTPEEKQSDDLKMKKVEEACKQANAHEFITKLPSSYMTQVGERGLLLSGGQKQRLAIARAIIKDPKILLLGIIYLIIR